MTRIEDGIFSATFARHLSEGNDLSICFLRACEAVWIFRKRGPHTTMWVKNLSAGATIDECAAILREAVEGERQ